MQMLGREPTPLGLKGHHRRNHYDTDTDTNYQLNIHIYNMS